MHILCHIYFVTRSHLQSILQYSSSSTNILAVYSCFVSESEAKMSVSPISAAQKVSPVLGVNLVIARGNKGPSTGDNPPINCKF